MILPRGLEVKKVMGALATLSTIELCRRLLRLRRVKVIRIGPSPLSKTDATESEINLVSINALACDRPDSLSQSEIANRIYANIMYGIIANMRPSKLHSIPGYYPK